MGIMSKWISRQEEAELPSFNNHQEAKDYFKDKYKERFVFTGVEDDIYFYSIIHDQAAYDKGQEEMRSGGFTTGMEFMASHQPVEISRDGSIHIIH